MRLWMEWLPPGKSEGKETARLWLFFFTNMVSMPFARVYNWIYSSIPLLLTKQVTLLLLPEKLKSTENSSKYRKSQIYKPDVAHWGVEFRIGSCIPILTLRCYWNIVDFIVYSNGQKPEVESRVPWIGFGSFTATIPVCRNRHSFL